MSGKVELREFSGRVRADVTIGGHRVLRGRSIIGDEILDVLTVKISAMIESLAAELRNNGRPVSWDAISAELNCDRVTVGKSELTIYSV